MLCSSIKFEPIVSSQQHGRCLFLLTSRSSHLFLVSKGLTEVTGRTPKPLRLPTPKYVEWKVHYRECETNHLKT